MKVAALQQFLRSVGAPLSALGVSSHSLSAVEVCADALEPFHQLELAELADFLKRAEDSRQHGTVPLVDVPQVAPIRDLALKLAEDLRKVDAAAGDEAKEAERRINYARHQFQSGLADLAQCFGITAKCSEAANWFQLRRAKKQITDLKAAITGPESYRELSVAEGIQRLVELGDPVLKQLAGEYSVVSGRKKGMQLVEEILAEVTKHRPTGGKGAPSKPARTAGADQAKVDEMVRTLQDKVQEVKANPHALADTEVDALITQLRSGFASKQQQAIATAVVGGKSKTGADAVLRIRSALVGVKQNLDSQNA